MIKLEQLQPNAAVRGIVPDALVAVVSVQWYGSEALELNEPDEFIPAIVEFLDGDAHRVHYIRRPFGREPDFGVTCVNYDFVELLARAKEPA
jgi:hypothetical protein